MTDWTDPTKVQWMFRLRAATHCEGVNFEVMLMASNARRIVMCPEEMVPALKTWMMLKDLHMDIYRWNKTRYNQTQNISHHADVLYFPHNTNPLRTRDTTRVIPFNDEVVKLYDAASRS